MLPKECLFLRNEYSTFYSLPVYDNNNNDYCANVWRLYSELAAGWSVPNSWMEPVVLVLKKFSSFVLIEIARESLFIIVRQLNNVQRVAYGFM